MNWAPWTGATRCTGGPTPGARALLAFLLEEYGQASSLGIYNCRDVRGTSTTSTHGEGRAVDLKWPMSSAGRGTASGEAVVKRLGASGRRLGIQAIIYNRRIYSAVSPEGRAYRGAHPHYDHLHIELTPAAGRNLTLATLRSALGRTSFDLGGRLLRLRTPFMRGDDVREWQQMASARGQSLAADGIFGPKTEEATKAVQRSLGVTADGIVGPVTLRAARRPQRPDWHGKRVVARRRVAFYRTPGWQPANTPHGFLEPGWGFRGGIHERRDVGGGSQYLVSNSSGHRFWITTNEEFIRLVG